MPDDAVNRRPTAAEVAKTLRSDNAVPETLDKTVNPDKNAHPFLRGMVDNLAHRGEAIAVQIESVAGVVKTAGEVLADASYYRLHPSEIGAEQKTRIADAKIGRAIDKAAVTIIDSVKTVGDAAADAGYYRFHPNETGAEQKVRSADQKIETAADAVTGGVVSSLRAAGGAAKTAVEAAADRAYYAQHPEVPGAEEKVRSADYKLGGAVVDVPLETANAAIAADGLRQTTEGALKDVSRSPQMAEGAGKPRVPPEGAHAGEAREVTKSRAGEASQFSNQPKPPEVPSKTERTNPDTKTATGGSEVKEGQGRKVVPVETPAEPANSRTPARDGGRESISKDGKPGHQADGRLVTSSEGSGPQKAQPTLVGTDKAKFMQDAARLIRETPDHPLKFLLDENGNFRTTRGLKHSEMIDRPDLVQAGHTISDKAGGQRIVLQDAWSNQFNNVTVEHPGKGRVREFAYVQIEAVDLGGIGVEKETAKMWESEGKISNGTVEAAKQIDTEAHGQSAPEGRSRVEPDVSKDPKLSEIKAGKVTDGKVEGIKAPPIEPRVRVQVPPETTGVRVEVVPETRVRVQVNSESESEEHIVSGHDITGRARMVAYRSQPEGIQDAKPAKASDGQPERERGSASQARPSALKDTKIPDKQTAPEGRAQARRATSKDSAPTEVKVHKVADHKVEGSKTTPVEPRVPAHLETKRDASKEARLPNERPATDNRGKRDGSQPPPIEPRVAVAPPAPNQVPEIKPPQP